MSTLAILDKTVCILLCVHLWSGRRRLRAEDLGAQARNLPPADLASLGSLKLCDPDQLTRLNSIKRAAERDLEKRCVRFLGGYATEENHIPTLVSKLQAHQARFEQQAQVFVDRLHTEIEAWIAQHPPWAEVIRKALPDPAYVRGRLQFAYQVFRVGVVSDDHQAEVNRGLLEATGGLSGQLFREIEQEARSTWEKSFQGRVAVGQKALRPLRTLLQKLHALQFIDARTRPIIQRIDTVLEALPSSGWLEGNDRAALEGLLHLLSSAKRMKAHGAEILNAQTKDSPREAIDDTDLGLPTPGPAEPVSGTASEPGVVWF